MDNVKKIFSPRSLNSERLEKIHEVLYNELGLNIEYGKTGKSITYLYKNHRLFHYYTPTTSKNYSPYSGEDALEFLEGNLETMDAYKEKQNYSTFPYQRSRYGIIFPFTRFNDTNFNLFLEWLRSLINKDRLV